MTAKLRPSPLYTGQTVGIAAPASGVWLESDFQQAVETMGRWGFAVTVPPAVQALRRGYLSGTDAERADSVNVLLRDPTVAAIICLRGGSGSLRLLPLIDYAAMAAQPRIFLGFSDVTALHVAFGVRSNVVTFHGPNLLGLTPPGGNAFTQEHCWRALMTGEALGEVPADPANPFVWVIAPGEAEGEIIGGCLTLLAATLGTPYELDTTGKILFFEDVGCPPYQIDTLLTQMGLAGKLQAGAGIVVGRCVDVEPDTRRGYHPSLSLDDVLRDHLSRLGIPVIYGLPLGHTYHQVTLPLGVMARLTTAPPVLTVTGVATDV
ncbi:MAG: LD-carboxypeptidase [Candidatus Sericytochromatia bacterium]|nr:LD-carboxypeptidase [Candidatus Sericytochromatia bacterium]